MFVATQLYFSLDSLISRPLFEGKLFNISIEKQRLFGLLTIFYHWYIRCQRLVAFWQKAFSSMSGDFYHNFRNLRLI